MARYVQTYSGERRTASLQVQLTGTERAAIETAAREAGAASLSAYGRALLLRRVGEADLVAGTRRNPEAQVLARELAAIGNNLNQLTRIANAAKTPPALADLTAVTGLLKAALARVIAL